MPRRFSFCSLWLPPRQGAQRRLRVSLGRSCGRAVCVSVGACVYVRLGPLFTGVTRKGRRVPAACRECTLATLAQAKLLDPPEET